MQRPVDTKLFNFAALFDRENSWRRKLLPQFPDGCHNDNSESFIFPFDQFGDFEFLVRSYQDFHFPSPIARQMMHSKRIEAGIKSDAHQPFGRLRFLLY